jgi:hypothetical protein
MPGDVSMWMTRSMPPRPPLNRSATKSPAPPRMTAVGNFATQSSNRSSSRSVTRARRGSSGARSAAARSRWARFRSLRAQFFGGGRGRGGPVRRRREGVVRAPCGRVGPLACGARSPVKDLHGGGALAAAHLTGHHLRLLPRRLGLSTRGESSGSGGRSGDAARRGEAADGGAGAVQLAHGASHDLPALP